MILRTTRAPLRAVALALLAVAAPLASLAAQADKPEAAPQAPGAKPQAGVGSIVGFSSMPWGTTEAAIRGQLGEPVRDEYMQGNHVLMYTDRVLEQDVYTLFYVHPVNGLVAGAYMAQFTTGNSCEDIYRKFKDAVAGRYPNLRPEVDEHTERSLSLCTALAIHRGSASTSWRDPANGAVAFVEIKYGESFDERYVETMYVSSLGAEIAGRSAATERATRF